MQIMQNAATTKPAKLDNLFGVCHALGEAFGFDPLYLRIAIVIGILVNFEVTAICYAVAAVAIVTAHLLNGLLNRTDGARTDR